MVQQSILVIDDQPVYRDAIREKLASAFAPHGVSVKAVGSAHEGLDCVDQASQTAWLIVLDILMPGLSGLTGIKAFKHKPNVAHVVVLSGLEAHLWEPRTVNAGASLFLSKRSTSEDITQKLQGLWASTTTLPLRGARGANAFRLTSRQQEVLQLIAQGHPNKWIADVLHIREQTVNVHLSHLFRELRVFNRAQAVIKAKKHQLI